MNNLNEEDKPLSVTDSEEVDKVLKQFHQLRQLALQSDEAAVDRILQLNRDGASFYEKLAVLNAGVLVFFLNFVISRSQTVHIARGTFLWLFCPAEALLLLSIYLCGRSIIHFHQTNILASRNLASNWLIYTTQSMSVFTAKFGALISGNLQRGTGGIVDISERFKQYTTLLQEAATENEKARQKQMAEYRDSTRQKQIAQLMTIVALTLLCIFMLKTLPM